MSKKTTKPAETTDVNLEKRRKIVDNIATAGLILIAVALAAPFAATLFSDPVEMISNSLKMIKYFKWVFAAGALTFTVARMVNVNSSSDSLRLRRLRRLEFWAGIAFCIGGFFWFYNSQKYGVENMLIITAGPLAVLRDTIIFSLVGAIIQLIASWMVAFRMKKESVSRKG
ncbi:MAG: hypothetical protein NC328_00910 [Muribaculum sp.]|nr:hypothetical protein [Muribaculum sp.]